MASIAAKRPALNDESEARCRFLFPATGATAAVGSTALARPFVARLALNAEAVAPGALIKVDLAPILHGRIDKLFWRGKLIVVRHRTSRDRGR